MHEMALMSDVLHVVLDECKGKDVKAVRSIHLTIGEQRDIIEEFAQGLFQYLARDTIASDAELVIKRIPFTVRCLECGNIFKINVHDETTWCCPRCNVRQRYRVFTGHEFQIDSLEVVLESEEETGSNEGSSCDTMDDNANVNDRHVA